MNGFTVIDGFLYMGNYSPKQREVCLGYAPGRQWRKPYRLSGGLLDDSIARNVLSGWVPVEEYVAYITGLADEGHPSLLEKWQEAKK